MLVPNEATGKQPERSGRVGSTQAKKQIPGQSKQKSSFLATNSRCFEQSTGFWRKQLESVNGGKGSPQLPKSKERLFLAETTCSSSVQFSTLL
jgi:hypothetical protein